MEPIKDAFQRLSQFGRAAMERALPVWRLARLRSERGLQWLRLRPQARSALFSAGMGIVTLLLLVFSGVTAAVAALAAWFALIRHFGQTNADRQRRITESFSKAVEQLGSDKLEVRLGGIYSLERISKESPDDYWTVMENLTAFVREHSRQSEVERATLDLEQRISQRAYFLWQGAGRPDGQAEGFWMAAAEHEEFGEPSATDIAAVLAVLQRRSVQNREREGANGWRFDLRGAVLNRANLFGAHLEGTNFFRAHLGRANLINAHLGGVNLIDAHLEGADLRDANLEGADLGGAHFERASLGNAHLEGANLFSAHLDRADLSDAHLGGAHLRDAHLRGANFFNTHLERANLSEALLERAGLSFAHLEGANLFGAHLERAGLSFAHLEGADLFGAHLERADLSHAHLEGANLGDAHLEGADLSSATGLSAAQLLEAIGDAATKLPKGMARPAHWPEIGA